ncbi:hypothetical protein ABZ805_13150 [Saccharopolyspora sp. NPDC047091]|uniref:hypothetical protein n=1 Tax=Saccharopolyspora sp. NPDC047091 TaxID=3155924 RepID=UPI0033EB8C7C
MLLCPALRDLTVRMWILLPPLFLAGASGVAALVSWSFEPGRPGLEVSPPVLLGFAAGLALLTGGKVRWSRDWQRFGLRFAYPAAMFGCALGADRVLVPLLPTLLLGGVAIVALVVVAFRGAARHCDYR